MVFSKKRLRGAGMFLSFGQAKEPNEVSSAKPNELKIKIIDVLPPHTQQLQPPLWLLTW